MEVLPVVGYHPKDGCLSLFIALRWMQRPCGVMMWVAGSKTKTKINPLERMEGVALLLYFRLGLIRASS